MIIAVCCRVEVIVDDQITNSRKVGRIGQIRQRAEAQAEYIQSEFVYTLRAKAQAISRSEQWLKLYRIVQCEQ